MKKVILYTNQQAFEADCKLYGNRLTLEKAIRAEVKKLLPEQKFTSDFFKDCRKNFYKLMAKQYPKHLELMKVEKIPDMIDMDISKLMKLIFQYEQGDGQTNRPAPCTIKSPSQNQYEDLAESQEEIDKFEAVQKVIDAIYEAEKVLDIEVYKGNIIQGFKGWISGQIGSQELWFNTQQVLNQRRYKKKKELVV